MSVVTMKSLLEAGVHFGHQTRRWNPKMKKYIFIERNGIYIIDLKKTLDSVNYAYEIVKDCAAKGLPILFVGTKKQAKTTIEEEAKRCGAYYVSERWYGGMLTNFKTIRGTIDRLNYIDELFETGNVHNFTKKEGLKLEKEREKLQKNLGGIRDMDTLPGLVFVVDTKAEDIAVAECNRLGIPIVGLVDTNCDPDVIDYVIPANDDAIRAVKLLSSVIAEAVIEGRNIATEGAGIEEMDDEEMTEEVEEVSETSEKPVED